MSPKYLPIEEFVRLGYLHEINRRILHPLGLALEVTQHEDGTETLSGIWDYRDDPEGVVFTDLDSVKMAFVRSAEEARKPARMNALGYWIQGDKS